MLDFSALAASPLIRIGAGVVFWLVAARLLSAHEVGLVAAAVAALWVCILLSLLGVGTAVIRLYPNYNSSPGTLLRPAFLIVTTSSLIAASSFIVLTEVLFDRLRFMVDIGFAPLFIAACTVGAINLFADEVAIAMWRLKFILARALVAAALTLFVLVVLVVGAGEQSAAALFVCWLAGFVGAAVLALGQFGRTVWRATSVQVVSARRLIRVGLENHALTLADLAPSFVIPLVITELMSPEENAYWYAVWMAFLTVVMIPIFGSTLILAQASDPAADVWGVVKYRLALGLLFGGAAALVLAVLADVVLGLLGADYARAGNAPLRILLIGVLPLAVVQAYYAVSRARQRLHEATITSLISGALLVAGSAWTGTRWGLTGIAVNWVAIQTAAGWWCFLRLRNVAAYPRASVKSENMA